jgi:hypothetical protein
VSANELDLGVPFACQVGFGLLGWVVLSKKLKIQIKWIVSSGCAFRKV